MKIFQYDADVPASVAVERRRAAHAAVGDGGRRLVRRQPRLQPVHAFQNGTPINLNAVDFGAAYLPQNQDPTNTSTVPGAAAYTTNLLRPYPRPRQHQPADQRLLGHLHSIQTSFTRRFRNGFSFGANYTYGISFKGTTDLMKRLQHAPDGTISVRADQAQYEDLMSDLDRRPHYLKANAVWDLPNVDRFGRVVGASSTTGTSPAS